MKIIRKIRKVYSLQQKLVEFINRNNDGPAIYMFHQVNNDKNTWLDENVCITKDSFHRFIEMLQSESINFYPIEQLYLHLDDRSAVFLTFDDIFSDAYENALEYLENNKIPYTVFITQNYVGKHPFISEEQFLTLEQSNLCTIGYHTKNHPFMRELKGVDMKNEIENNTFHMNNKNNDAFFAFPYGSVFACPKRSIIYVKKCGYSMAFSTIAARCNRRLFDKNRWFLPRINVNEKNYTKVI